MAMLKSRTVKGKVARLLKKFCAYARCYCFYQVAVLPDHLLQHEAAACAQALHGALTQRIGQGRQQVYGAVVALQQHLCDASGAAEITVDLERRMRVEEVGIGAARHAETAARRDQRELVRN